MGGKNSSLEKMVYKREEGDEKLESKVLLKELDQSRKNFQDKLSHQNYSLTEEFPDFSTNRGGFAKLDLCVIANMPLKNMAMFRKDCQDDAVAIKLTEDSFLVAVFDGHGPKGGMVARSCVRLLQKKCANEDFVAELLSDPEKSFSKAINEFHRMVGASKELHPSLSGTTATLCLVDKNKINLSWVGDSKAVLLTSPHPKFLHMRGFELTRDHDFTNQAEIDRVRSVGGILSTTENVTPEQLQENKINVAEPMRLWSPKLPSQPGLMMSRSIGDLLAHDCGASADPDFICLNVRDLPEEFRSGAAAISKVKTLRVLENQNLSEDAQKHQQRVEEHRNLVNQGSQRSWQQTEQQRKKIQKKLSSAAASHDGEVEVEEIKKSKKKSKKKTSVLIERKLTMDDSEESFSVKHCVVVVASDGVWSIMDKNEVAMFLSLELYNRCINGADLKNSSQKKIEESNLAAKLCVEAQNRWLNHLASQGTASSDDISAVVMVLY